MGWLDDYRVRRTTAAEAVRAVNSGERVYLGSGCAVPHALVEALTARATELTGVEILQVLTIGPAPYTARELADHFRCNALFIGPNVREAVNEGRADYVPVHLHQAPELLRDGSLPLDHAFVVVSPPDEHGFCSFGIEVAVTKPAALAARRIVAEVNRHMPRTLGDSFIHVSKIDAFVEVDRALDTWRPAEPNPTEKRIGEHVAGLVEDGACLQVGIGGIPGAVLDYLDERRDLGVHTEMFSDGLQRLIERGVVTGERKNFHPGKVVAGFLLGSRELYDFAHDNAQIEFHPSDYVNNPFNIARNDRMIAVNGALQVDLTGQVCADSLGTSFYSGFGGQVDFMRGAALSRGDWRSRPCRPRRGRGRFRGSSRCSTPVREWWSRGPTSMSSSRSLAWRGCAAGMSASVPPPSSRWPTPGSATISRAPPGNGGCSGGPCPASVRGRRKPETGVPAPGRQPRLTFRHLIDKMSNGAGAGFVAAPPRRRTP